LAAAAAEASIALHHQLLRQVMAALEVYPAVVEVAATA
jgi:hypothetical protein